MPYNAMGMQSKGSRVDLPKQMGGFPAVGNGLGGLPVRKAGGPKKQPFWTAQFLQSSDGHPNILNGGAIEIGGEIIAVGRNYYTASQSSHFVAKYASDGTPIYTRRNKDATTQNVSLLLQAVSLAGNVYVIGRYPGPTQEASCIGRIDPVSGNSISLHVGPSGLWFQNSICALGTSLIVVGAKDSLPSLPLVQIYDAALTLSASYLYTDSSAYSSRFLSVCSDGTHAYVCGNVINSSNEPYPAILKITENGTLVARWRYVAQLYQTFVHGSCVVSGGYLYTMGENSIRQIDTTTGTVLWEGRPGGSTFSPAGANKLASGPSGSVYALFHNNAGTNRTWYVGKYGSDGVCEWTTSINYPSGLGAALDLTGISVIKGALFVSGATFETAGGGRRRAVLIKLMSSGQVAASGLNGLDIASIAPIGFSSGGSYSPTTTGGTYASVSVTGWTWQSPTNEAVSFSNTYIDTYATA